MLFTGMILIHVLAVIVWIGGLAFITMLIFPAMYRIQEPLQKVLFFQRIEHRFAPMARIYNAVVGITGFAMLVYTGWYSLLFTLDGLFLTIMVLIWVMWAVMLFGLEPLVIKKMLDSMVKKNEKMEIDAIFRKMNIMHWVLLLVSLVAAGSGVMFAHGPALF